MSFVNLGMGLTLVDALNCRYFSDAFNFPNIRLLPFRPRIMEPLEIITSNVRPLLGMARDFYDGLILELDKILGGEQAPKA